MSVDGEEKFQEDYRLEVYPHGLNLAEIPIALYDPQNKLVNVLRRAGVIFTPIQDLQTWNGQDILVIAPNALLSSAEADAVPLVGVENDLRTVLEAKIQAGGRVLVLEQSWESPPGILPVRLDAHQSTLAFIQSPSHPILSGLTHADLRWWRDDNLVSTSEPLRASEAGIHALVVTGDASGISHAPLVEINQGQGVWIVCQLLVASKLEDEPMAQVLLERMLTYLAHYQPPAGKTLYVPTDWEISALKAAAQPLRSWDELQFPTVRLLIIHGNGEMIPLERLQSFMKAGGIVLWDRPSAEINSILNAIHAKVEMQLWTGATMRAEGAFPLLDFLTREDLYWIGRTPSELAANTNAIFVPEASSISTQGAIPAVENAELEGQILREQGGEILMATNGKVTWEIEFPQDGMYQFILLAYGTPLSGVYPQAQVMVDNVPIGMLIVASKAPRAYQLFFNGQAGKHRVSVAFTNDEYNPPEDRNLILSAYLVSPVSDMGDIESLAIPAALVNMPIGKGRLILSTIEWDNAGQNSLRGQRYFAGLLTGLGVTYAAGGAPVFGLEAESLAPMPNFLYFEVAGGNVAMYTEGYIQGPIRVTRPGRYRIGILAKGTPVGGIYPILQIELNDKVLGEVNLTGGWEMHYILVELSDGTFPLRLRFINDAWSPATGEDRNVWIDRIEFERVE